MKALPGALGRCLLLLALACWGAPARSAGSFECGGSVEARTWALWEGQARSLLGNAVIRDAFAARGDTYVLYDLQGYLHNLVAMAERCGRRERLADIASLLMPTLDALSEVRGQGPGWICRGGRVCTSANRMLGDEVVLYSAQYMALLTGLARGLSGEGEADDVVERIVRLAVAHLDRWASAPGGFRTAERLAARSPESVRDGSSRLLFTDADLWILTFAADVAGIVDARSDLQPLLAAEPARRQRRNEAVADLSRLLVARLSLRSVNSQRLGARVVLADIDRGYWRLYPDSRFAGYAGNEPPLACGSTRASEAGDAAPQVSIVDSIGWDFSHARRLVHAAASLDRHREAFRSTYAVPAASVPPAGLSAAFAAQLANDVWNGDAEWPLFANYWDGSNGWYRVGHDRGAAGCLAGYPPFGLSDAFVTGGFPVWSRHVPLLGTLARRLFELTERADDASRAFLRHRYAALSDEAARSTRVLTQLMFWPALVQPAVSSQS